MLYESPGVSDLDQKEETAEIGIICCISGKNTLFISEAYTNSSTEGGVVLRPISVAGVTIPLQHFLPAGLQ